MPLAAEGLLAGELSPEERSASLRAAWIRADDCVGGQFGFPRGDGEGGKRLTSSSISLRVLIPFVVKNSSRGFCSSLFNSLISNRAGEKMGGGVLTG